MSSLLSGLEHSAYALAAYVLGVIFLSYLLVSKCDGLLRVDLAKYAAKYEAFATNFPKIKGLPEVPNGLPFIGHLAALGGRRKKNDSTVYAEWARQLNTDIFQCRLGNQRTVVVNSWAAMKDIWVGQSNSLSDRPDQPEFVEKLGVDITGTSLTPQIRKCRMAGMRALGKPNWPKYYHLVEPTSVALIRDMYNKGQNGKVPMDVYYHLRHVVFDLALSLTYGARFGEVNDAFMTRFLWSINAISAVRNSTKTFRHYVPILRWIPQSTTETIMAEKVRAQHTDILYSSFRKRVAAGETVDCIVNSLGEDKLSEEEIHGTCLSLLQAAPDTVASSVYQGVAWLSSLEGQSTQEAVYEAILVAYSGDRTAAWNSAFREEKVPLLVGLYKETMRFFTVAPFAIPRQASKDIEYRGIKIPKGMAVILNSQAVSHDTEQFGADAWHFNPERYLHDDSPLPHSAFGAGSRICPAVGISNRLTYAILMRLILAFRFHEPVDGMGRKPDVHPINFSDSYQQVVSHPKFFDCHFVARDAEWLASVSK